MKPGERTVHEFSRDFWMTEQVEVLVTESEKTVYIDLHGYSVENGLEIARQYLEAAWRNGYTRAVFVHGAADVESLEDARKKNRGVLKWRLREELDTPELSRYGKSIHQHMKDTGFIAESATSLRATFSKPDQTLPAVNAWEAARLIAAALYDSATMTVVIEPDNKPAKEPEWPDLPPKDY